MYTPHPGTMIYGDERITIVSNDLEDYTHLRLIAVPKSLGSTEEAIQLLHDVQRDFVRVVSGTENLLDVEKVTSNINGFVLVKNC